jgi:AraC-like DNA-binding protein/quercetin dioxygenase-like cupin family protein
MEICTHEHPIRFSYVHTPIREKKVFSKDMHAEYEMLLFLEGGLSYVVEDRKFPVTPYTLILVPPNTYHFAVPEGEGAYWRYMLAFKARAVGAGLLEKLFAQSGCYRLEEDHPVVQSFRQLHALRTEALADYDDLLLQNTCTQILLGLLARQRMSEAEGSGAQRTLDYPLIDYIEENLTAIRSVEEIAEHFFVSASTISHHFKSRMGISIMKYIRHKRLLLAKALLEKGEKPQKAAEKAGFREYSTFYKAYLRQFGTAPGK